MERPSGERPHIAFFGLRNAGKSSVVNAVTGQELSIISDVKGTTTDPVQKAMELLPLGPVVIIDTPGIDDAGELGELRVRKTRKVLEKTDAAVLVTEKQGELSEEENRLLALFREKKIPFLLVRNKKDLFSSVPKAGENELFTCAKTGEGIWELKERLAALLKTEEKEKYIVRDLIEAGDAVVLVVPIDASAPKGRLILPQQQTIRELLEAGTSCIVTRETELKQTLEKLKEKPKMVITDSQAFEVVAKDTPEDVLLTSFSILFARYKGSLELAAEGAFKLDDLKDGDTVLISEGCSHHRQCEDIGTVKLPNWIRGYTGKELNFAFTSGGTFPDDLSDYALVVHCGACMLNEREVQSRMRRAAEKKVPMTNYGIAIAHIHGILERSLSPFPALLAKVKK